MAPNLCVCVGGGHVKYLWGLGIYLEMQGAMAGSKKTVMFELIVSGEPQGGITESSVKRGVMLENH